MERTILVQERALSPKIFYTRDNSLAECDLTGRIVIGRNVGSNHATIAFNEKFVSRSHGEIYWDQWGCYYIDTNSSNGSYLNGKKVAPGQKNYLRNGDVIHIFGGNRNHYEFVALIFSTDYPEGWVSDTIVLTSGISEVTIGRSSNQRVQLGEGAVSAKHASFFAAHSHWAIADHNSANGVFVNNHRLGAATYLNIGDCVRIVNSYFVFYGNKIVY